MLRFETIVYPLWRRKMPTWIKPFAINMMRRYAPVDVDEHPPQDERAMAEYLSQWGIIQNRSIDALAYEISNSQPPIEIVDLSQQPQPHQGSKIRVPAQWEPIERVLIRWGVVYPRVWDMTADMVRAISAVAKVEIVVPNEMWARAVWIFLAGHGTPNIDKVHFVIVPTDDIWIRDYGPIAGVAEQGKRVFVDTHYDPLPHYPQAHDNAFIARYAAHHHTAYQLLDLHFEGGNLWSDGKGTWIISEEVFSANRYHTRDTLLMTLQRIFDVQKLIITPRLILEETGHVDLIVKLVDEETIFVSAPDRTNGENLRKTHRLFERETNAQGNRYQVVTLPTPPLYLNWGVFPIRRHYTNALTVNGCVLVPTYGLNTDAIALELFAKHMPNYRIIPIDSRVGIHGGGAVHCMTREIF